MNDVICPLPSHSFDIAPQPGRFREAARQLACFVQREAMASLHSRFLHVLCAAALLAGIAPLFASESNAAETAPYFLLQAVLYLIPLFAVLIGAGSAQAEIEERPFLLSQPVSRFAIVPGKMIALWLLIALAAALLVVPAALAGGDDAALAFIWLNAVGVGGVFLSLGFAAGYATDDRVKAHLAALTLWLLLLAGGDLAALALAHIPAAQARPQAWSALLMLNPLDAVRVGALFTLDRVPFDLAAAPPLARWWLGHPGLWSALICVAWSALATAWSARRAGRIEC
jgi:hypothetical protein